MQVQAGQIRIVPVLQVLEAMSRVQNYSYIFQFMMPQEKDAVVMHSPWHGPSRKFQLLGQQRCCTEARSLACLAHAALPAAQVDILLNNAGLALGTAPVQGTTSSDALGMITTNCSAVVRAAPGRHSTLHAAHA